MSPRRVISGIGRSLISTGVLLLFFVGYQLWGTGIAQGRLQNAASKDFELALAAVQATAPDPSVAAVVETVPVETTTIPPSTVAPTTKPGSPPTKPVPTTTPKPTTKPAPTTSTLPKVRAGRTKMQRPKAGKAMGRIVIKRIGLDQTVVEGSDKESLKTGPGHYPKTPLPGQPGNSAIACHRTTYGAPCFNLHLVKPGDEILVQTLHGTFRYIAERQWRVKPKGPAASEVLAATPGENVLTLTTCEPQYSAAFRLILRARLVGEAAPEDLYEELPVATTIAAEPAAVNAADIGLETDDAIGTEVGASGQVGGTDLEIDENPELTIDSNVPAISNDDGAVTGEDGSGEGQLVAGDGGLRGPTIPALELADGGSLIEAVDPGGTGPIRSFFWFRGHQSTWLKTVLLAAICALVWLAAWRFAHRRKRIAQAVIYTAGFCLFFLPALYFCFEQLSRLLPESV